MRPSEPWLNQTRSGRVVHLVGSVTDDVFNFLLPATQALAESGVEQSVVLVDDLRFRHLLPRFPDAVELVLTPASRNPYRRWQWALEAFVDVLKASPTNAAQLHGPMSCLLGAWVVRLAGIRVPLHHAPRGSTSLGPFLSASDVLRWIAWPDAPEREAARKLAPRNPGHKGDTTLPAASFERVESPVNPAFFTVKRNEARRPLVVTSHHLNNPRGAELFAQLAVLLGGEDPGLGFNWIGTADHGSMVRLKAAQVGVFPVKSEYERASRMASGWVYFATGEGSGFPRLLVEAMASGMPCVALDSPHHRDVIRHGETGFLCHNEHDLTECIATLVGSSDLRQQVGQAARAEAERRFGEQTFRDALFAAYDLPTDVRRVA